MLSRRQTLISAAAAVAFAPAAFAEIVCEETGGGSVCEAGVRLGNAVTSQQRCPQWCWAACIEAIFALNGHDVPQEEIVGRLFGDLYCAPANGPMIVEAVTGAWMSPEGRFRADAEVLIDAEFGFGDYDAAYQAALELQRGQPLIIGAAGHAMLLTAMTFTRDSSGRFGEVVDVVVRDPWPDMPNRRGLTWEEAQSIQFLSKVRVG
jgi:hypothetical protein